MGHLIAGQCSVGVRRSRVQARKDGPGSACCPPQVAYFQSALDKLNEAIKLAKVKLKKSLATPQSSEITGGRPGGAEGCPGTGLGWC